MGGLPPPPRLPVLFNDQISSPDWTAAAGAVSPCARFRASLMRDPSYGCREFSMAHRKPHLCEERRSCSSTNLSAEGLTRR